MKISTKLKQRFCMDCNIPITIFQEPYFSDRLILYDDFYGTCKKWNLFVKELEKYKTEQDYYEDYNRVKDAAINYIKSTEAYKEFNEEDMKQYAIVNRNLPGKDIYKSHNDGKVFISIDMKEANFSSLRFYDKSIFDNTRIWKEFISKFTDNKHIINSKYIRQVILGNCNAGRHITYEKYLMDIMLNYLLNSDVFTIDRVVSFTNDEIVIDVSDMSNIDQIAMLSCIKNHLELKFIPLKVEFFKLNKIIGTDGYYKTIYNDDSTNNIKFKCLDSLYLPFVIRSFLGEEVEENDKMFYHHGLLSKFIEVPKIEVE